MADFLPLNFPRFAFDLREEAGKTLIRDTIRRRFVRLTPEEWVRQHLLRFLVEEGGYPTGLLAVEKEFQYLGAAVRADVVAYDRHGAAYLMAECKAPDVAVTQAVFEQAARYNTVLRAGLLVVTNGLTHYVCALDHAAGTFRFLDHIPPYERL